MSKTVVVGATLWQLTSQASHIAVSCILLAAVKRGLGSAEAMWFAALCVVLAALKEFIYDYHFETPDERGSSLLDFACYMAGLGLGWLV